MPELIRLLKELNEVLTNDNNVRIALETMAGKGTEIGRSFEEVSTLLLMEFIITNVYQYVLIHVIRMMLDIM